MLAPLDAQLRVPISHTRAGNCLTEFLNPVPFWGWIPVANGNGREVIRLTVLVCRVEALIRLIWHHLLIFHGEKDCLMGESARSQTTNENELFVRHKALSARGLRMAFCNGFEDFEFIVHVFLFFHRKFMNEVYALCMPRGMFRSWRIWSYHAPSK